MDLIKSRLNKLVNYIKKNPIIMVLVLIALFAFFLRVFLLIDNFVLDGDAARDAIIVKQAIQRMEFPPIGPFSSAGPFVTGPIYYWLIILASVLLPFGLFDSWVLLLIIGVLNVCIFMYIGYLLKGHKLAIILGLISATSFQLIYFSLNLTNPTFIPFFTSFVILFFILLIKKKNVIYALLLGLSLGLILNFHYQALNLLIFLPFIFLIKDFSLQNKFISVLLAILGLIIPMFPLFYWDSKQGFSNFYNVLDYLLVAQYRIYVPNSWKIFLFQDMITFWGNAIGGFRFTGLVSMIILGVGGLLAIPDVRKNLKRSEIYLIPAILFILLFVNRYYHGARQEIYLLYLTPFIVVCVGLAIYYIFNSKYVKKLFFLKLGLIILFAGLIIGNLYIYVDTFNKQIGNYESYLQEIGKLKKEYPNEKFSVYDFQSQNTFVSLPFSLLLAEQGLQSTDGIKLGVGAVADEKVKSEELVKVTHLSGVPVNDISNLSSDVVESEFNNVNEESVYLSLMGWAKKNELTHTFNIMQYLKEKL